MQVFVSTPASSVRQFHSKCQEYAVIDKQTQIHLTIGFGLVNCKPTVDLFCSEKLTIQLPV